MSQKTEDLLMATVVTLDQKHSKVATRAARELGTTAEQYVHSLIDAANMTFDEILAPARKGFRESGMTEEDLDDLVNRARKSVYAKRQKGGKK
jgi:hypothetical protein